VPTPQWSSFSDGAATPAACLIPDDGGAPLAERGSRTAVFSPDWTAPRSIRGQLSWEGGVAGGYRLSLEGTVARHQNQSSVVNLNLDTSPRMTLVSEGGRPVFVDPQGIDPGTGTVSSAQSRLSHRFGRVDELRSDLLSDVVQLRVGLGPAGPPRGVGWSVGYTVSAGRQQTRGSASTAGDPNLVEWATPSHLPRHAIHYGIQWGHDRIGRVAWFGQLRSGTRFTPLVARDINGDGLANDRAFVFAPGGAGSQDAALADLLARGSSAAKKCLTSQVGRIAAHNSCESGWSSNATLQIDVHPHVLRLPRHASVSVVVANPLAVADWALHPHARHGWGQTSAPDAILLYPRGFDAAKQQFTYAVNPDFGRAASARSAFHTPAALSLLLRLDIGPSRERQTLLNQLDRGRRQPGDPVPALSLRATYGSGGVANPMTWLLRYSDSLQLSGAQADSIATWNRTYLASLDSIWTPVTNAWASLPPRYDRDAAVRQLADARRAGVDQLLAIAPRISAILTAAQRRRLPRDVANLLDPKYLSDIRHGRRGGTW